MGDSSTTYPTTIFPKNKGSTTKTKSIRNSRGATVMVKLTKVWNTSVRMSIDFNVKWGRCYGEHDMIFRI